MKKGKFGLCFWVYAVTGFVLAVMEQLLPCLLLTGFVLAAERDEKAVRPVLEALFLCLITMIVKIVPSALISVLTGSSLLVGIVSAMYYIFNVAVFISAATLAGIGIINALRGSNAGTPLLSKLANRAFGASNNGVYYQSPQRK